MTNAKRTNTQSVFFFVIASLAAILMGCGLDAFAQAPAPSANLTAVLQTYCEGCHNQNGAQAGLALDKLKEVPHSIGFLFRNRISGCNSSGMRAGGIRAGSRARFTGH